MDFAKVVSSGSEDKTSWWALNLVMSVLRRRGKDTQRPREEDAVRSSDATASQGMSSMASSCHKLGESHETDSPLVLPERIIPANTLTSDF